MFQNMKAQLSKVTFPVLNLRGQTVESVFRVHGYLTARARGFLFHKINCGTNSTLLCGFTNACMKKISLVCFVWGGTDIRF